MRSRGRHDQRGEGQAMRESPYSFGRALLLVAVLGGVSAVSATSMAGAAPVLRVAKWPVYGHDHANTRFNSLERDVNRRTVRQLTERWSKNGLVGVVGTPTVSNGDAYFDDLNGTLWAVRLSTGHVIWQTQIGAGAVAAPAITTSCVFAASGNTLYAVDRATGA